MAVTTNFSFTLTDFDKIPWHTEEHNNWHNIDALLARYLAISNVQGVWENATAVTVSQRYIDSADDTIWEVLVAHTTSSTSTFAAERAAQPTYWQSLSIDASFAGAWTAGESYSINQFVSDSRRYGVVTTAHTATTSYNQGVSSGYITTLIDATELVSTSPVATTLGVGSSATVAFNATTGVFTFGLPTGATGATGDVEGTLSTRGDILVRNASNVTARLAVGSANTVLKSDGSDVAYSTIATANVADDAITYAKIQNIGTGNRVLGRASTGEVSEVQVATAMIADDAVTEAKMAGGLQTIWVPASSMRPAGTNGCADIAVVDSGSNSGPDMQVLDFDKASEEFAQFSVAMPKSWDNDEITYQVYWIGLAATTTCIWGLQVKALGDGETTDVAYGSAVTVTDVSQGDAKELLVSPVSSAIACGGATSDLLYCQVKRDADDGSDNLDGDARLVGIKIFYTTNTGGDT